MGKKGSWISALKRVFASTPKDKLVLINGPDRDFVKEKKRWAIGKLRNGGAKPFIQLQKEPSSIEDILGDAEREHHRLQHHPEPLRKAQHWSSVESTVRNVEREEAKPLPLPPKRGHQPKALPANPTANARPPPPPPISPARITINYAQKSAIKIQAAYRGYMARKSCRALRGLVRLQAVMRGQSVKRQTMNALRLMQLFLRVQSQVRMRRIQAMERQNPQQQTPHMGEKEQDSNISKWSLSHKSDAEEQNQGEWDSTLLTKEEIDARTQRKVEAIMKRERALAYATSHQHQAPLKAPPKSPRPAPAGLRSGGGAVWWGWLERHFHMHHPTERAATPRAPPPSAGNRAVPDSPTRPSSRAKRSKLGPEEPDGCTPRSSHATMKTRGRPSSPDTGRNPPPSRAGGRRTLPRDDESLTSCPAFTAPGYMAPTLSAKAKVRGQAFQREAPPPAAKKRFSFGLSHSIGTLRWSKGSFFVAKEPSAPAQRVTGKHRPTHSTGNLSVDSTTSLPVGVGRKPFK